MYYRLDENKIPYQCTFEEWAEDFQDKEERILAHDIFGDILVSTVFLGLEHGYRDGLPLLWETMIFEGEHDGYQERYNSYKEAIKGHEIAVRLVNDKN